MWNISLLKLTLSDAFCLKVKNYNVSPERVNTKIWNEFCCINVFFSTLLGNILSKFKGKLLDCITGSHTAVTPVLTRQQISFPQSWKLASCLSRQSILYPGKGQTDISVDKCTCYAIVRPSVQIYSTQLTWVCLRPWNPSV